MLIACQKFRLRMIGHYNMSCHVIMHNMYATCYCMCSDIMRASCSTCMQACQLPYVYVACQKLLMDVPFMPAKLYLSKLTASHFGTLNTRIANQNVLKRIPIATHNENKANCNENFRICAEEPVAPLYQQ